MRLDIQWTAAGLMVGRGFVFFQISTMRERAMVILEFAKGNIADDMFVDQIDLLIENSLVTSGNFSRREATFCKIS
jgi:hypothetical protein